LFDAFARQHGLHIVGFVVNPRSAREAAIAAEKTNVTPQLAQTISSSLGCSMDFGCSFASVVVSTRNTWVVARNQSGMCLGWVKRREFLRPGKKIVTEGSAIQLPSHLLGC